MQKIVDGLKYDTNMAEKVAEWSNHYNCTDFNHFTETLYRTKNGRWFIFGQGNANSPYSEPVDNMRGPGANIVPISDNEAQQWLEKHDFVSELEEHFGDDIQEA